MFDFLKKKIKSWIKPDKTSSKKKPVKAKEKPSKSKAKKLLPLTKAEKQSEKETNEIIQQTEQSSEQQIIQEEQKEEEGKGNFFTRLLKKITTSKLTQEQFNQAF